MMFDTSEEVRMFIETIARFLADRMPFETRKKLAEGGVDSDATIWQELVELGVPQIMFSPDEGGAAGEPADIGALFMTLGAALSFEPFLQTLMVGKILAGDATHATLHQQVVSGEVRVGLAYEETDTYYDPRHIAASARKNDDHWCFSGCKVGIPIGASADYIIFTARTDTDAKDDLSLFVVSRDQIASRLVSSRAIDGGSLSELNLNGLVLAENALIGKASNGMALLAPALAIGTFATCAESVGIMNVMKDIMLDYLQTRMQFGTPIGTSQVLQHRYVELMIGITETESAVLNAASAMAASESTKMPLHAAKATASRIGNLVAEECIHMHGAIGLTNELPIAQYARRLVMMDHQFGDESVHLQQYVAGNGNIAHSL